MAPALESYREILHTKSLARYCAYSNVQKKGTVLSLGPRYPSISDYISMELYNSKTTHGKIQRRARNKT